MSRYRREPDIISKFIELEKRVQNLERVNQVGQTSIEQGEFSLRGGKIVAKNTNGDTTLEITAGVNKPSIKFFPLGESTGHEVELTSFDFGNVTAVQLSIDQVDGDVDGGKVLLWNDAAVLSHHPGGLSETEAYIALGGFPITGVRNIFMRGNFIEQYSQSEYDLYHMGSIPVGSGFSGLTYNYPVTYSGTMVPFLSIQSAAIVDWSLLSHNNSGFEVTWSGTTAKTVNFICFRMD